MKKMTSWLRRWWWCAGLLCWRISRQRPLGGEAQQQDDDNDHDDDDEDGEDDDGEDDDGEYQDPNHYYENGHNNIFSEGLKTSG